MEGSKKMKKKILSAVLAISMVLSFAPIIYAEEASDVGAVNTVETTIEPMAESTIEPTEEQTPEPAITPLPAENVVSYTDGSALITVTEDGEYCVIFSAYDKNGVLISIETKNTTLSADTVNVVTPETFSKDEAKMVKIMLWQSLAEMTFAAEPAKTSAEMFDSGEQYGWIMNIFASEDGENTIVRLMTANGTARDFVCAEKMDYWAPNAESAAVLSTAEEIKSALTEIEYVSAKVSKSDTPVRLAKFKTDVNNRLTSLCCASDATKVTDADAVRVDTNNLCGVAVVGNLVNGYNIKDGTLEIRVPKDAESMKDERNYSIGTVKASNYVVRENGSSYNYIAAEFSDSITPEVIVRFVENYDTTADIADMDTNANNPVMAVSAVDENADGTYTIHGFSEGKSVEVTTTAVTTLAKISTSSTTIITQSGTRRYNTTDLWNAKDDAVKLTDYISEGDLILYDGGERIIQLLDADDVYDVVVNGTDSSGLLFGSFNPFPARNMFVFAPLNTHSLTSDGAWIELDASALNKTLFDGEKAIDIIAVNPETGDVSVRTGSINDLEPFSSEEKSGDYVFARYALKGFTQEIIAYKFTDSDEEKTPLTAEVIPDTLLSEGESYGWIMDVYNSADGETVTVKLMTTDGEAKEIVCADELEYLAPNADSVVTLSSSEDIGTALLNIEYPKTTVEGAQIPVRLVKYKTDADNKLVSLYCASDAKQTDGAVTIDSKNLKETAAVGNLVRGYNIKNGTLEISVPNNVTGMTDELNYIIGEAVSSDYVVPETGAKIDYIAAEFAGGIMPTVIIRFIDNHDTPADIDDIDTIDNNPVMVVTSVTQNEDETYTVNGLANGKETSFTTSETTALAEINASNSIINNSRKYNHTDLWDAQSGSLDENNADAAFTDYLQMGDIVLYDTGDRLLRLLDADDVYNVVVNGADKTGLLFGAFNPYPARNMFVFAPLKQYDITSDGAWVSLDSSALNNILFDESKPINVITLDAAGEATAKAESMTISELEEYTAEEKTGDYVFARFCDKGTLQEVIVYKFI